MRSKNILISTGKTGGHIIPAISVGERYIEEFNEAKVFYVLLYNSKVLQDLRERNENFRFVFLRDWKSFNLRILCENIFKIFKIVKKENIKKVLIFGSYLSLPAIIASLLSRRELYIHEQNVLPGRANRFASFFSKKIFISYIETAKYFPFFLRKRVIISGNPVRKYPLKRGKEKNQILFLGGSQGAEAINEFILNNLDKIEAYPSIDFIVITGEKNYENVLKKVKSRAYPKNLKLLPFEYKVLDVMAESRLIVSRAGATTLSEIALLGRPSVLIPYPYAQDNHQYINAKYFEKRGAAFVIDNNKIADNFYFIITLFNSTKNLEAMGKAAHNLFIADAEHKIVKNLC